MSLLILGIIRRRSLMPYAWRSHPLLWAHDHEDKWDEAAGQPDGLAYSVAEKLTAKKSRDAILGAIEASYG